MVIQFDYEDDPDFSWLEQDCFAGENPADHVQLTMLVYGNDDDELTDSLGCIDFLKAEDNWTTGTFGCVRAIPERCDYQRTLAREAGLPE